MITREAALRAVLVLAALCAGLGVACVLLWRRTPASDAGLAQRALDDPELRRAAVAELVARGGGIWDTFPDPDVGLLLQPGLVDRIFYGKKVSTNAWGLRERPFALRKPAGTVRVVLLGDSFVMGQSVEADERFGARLERFLAERAGRAHGPIEVLHLGVNTWNVGVETAFLRRQISLLLPDLVVQLVVRNDLEDHAGARGFGGIANVNPAHPERGGFVFQAHHPLGAFSTRQPNWLAHGLDWESRSRFEAAGAAIGALARALREGASRYLLLDYYTGLLPVSRSFLARELDPAEVAFLPTDLIQDPRYRVSSEDSHWNAVGHELVAKLVYALIRQRGLLPALAPAEWPEADALAADWLARGEREAAPEPDLERLPGRRRIAPAVDFRALDDDAGAQVHGGIFGPGIVAPYASVILRCEGRGSLVLRGSALDRRELDGVRVEVFVDEARVGELVLPRARPFEATFPVPPAVAARRFVSARFQSSDYAYGEADLRMHVVFQLDRLELR